MKRRKCAQHISASSSNLTQSFRLPISITEYSREIVGKRRDMLGEVRVVVKFVEKAYKLASSSF